MHVILIEFLIDVAKGEQSIKISYLKGKKERIMKFMQACQHSFKPLHTCNLFQKDQCFVIIKKGEIVDSIMILMITTH